MPLTDPYATYRLTPLTPQKPLDQANTADPYAAYRITPPLAPQETPSAAASPPQATAQVPTPPAKPTFADWVYRKEMNQQLNGPDPFGSLNAIQDRVKPLAATEKLVDSIPKRQPNLADVLELQKYYESLGEGRLADDERGGLFIKRQTHIDPNEGNPIVGEGVYADEDIKKAPLWWKERLLQREPTKEELAKHGLQSYGSTGLQPNGKTFNRSHNRLPSAENPTGEGEIPGDFTDAELKERAANLEKKIREEEQSKDLSRFFETGESDVPSHERPYVARSLDMKMEAENPLYLKAKEALFNTEAGHSDRYAKALEIIQSIPKDQRPEFLYQARKAREIEEYSGRAMLPERMAQGVYGGLSRIANSWRELVGQAGTEEEIITMRALVGLHSPTLAKDPWWDRALTGASSGAPEMALSIGAGKATGIGAKKLGFGKFGQRAATTAGIMLAMQAQGQQDSYYQMRESGVSPEKAVLISPFVGAINGAIESIIPNPAGGVASGLSRKIKNDVARAGVELLSSYAGEMTEEALQNLTSELINVAATRADEYAPDLNYGHAIKTALKQTADSAATVGVLVGAGGAAHIGMSKATERSDKLESMKGLRKNINKIRSGDFDIDPDYLTPEMERYLAAQHVKRLGRRREKAEEEVSPQEETLYDRDGNPIEGRKVTPADELKAAKREVQQDTQTPQQAPVEEAAQTSTPATPPTDAAPQPVTNAETATPLQTSSEGGVVGATVATELNTPKVGQYVQWTSGGVDQWGNPKRITGVSEDGSFVFISGSKTGIPASEVTAVDETTQKLMDQSSQEKSAWATLVKARDGKAANKTIGGFQAEINKALRTLGLKASDDLSPQGLQNALRSAAMKSHPDRGGSTEAMAAVNEAYDLLTNSTASIELAKQKWDREHQPVNPETKASLQNPTATSQAAQDAMVTQQDPQASTVTETASATPEATQTEPTKPKPKLFTKTPLPQEPSKKTQTEKPHVVNEQRTEPVRPDEFTPEGKGVAEVSRPEPNAPERSGSVPQRGQEAGTVSEPGTQGTTETVKTEEPKPRVRKVTEDELAAVYLKATELAEKRASKNRSRDSGNDQEIDAATDAILKAQEEWESDPSKGDDFKKYALGAVKNSLNSAHRKQTTQKAKKKRGFVEGEEASVIATDDGTVRAKEADAASEAASKLSEHMSGSKRAKGYEAFYANTVEGVSYAEQARRILEKENPGVTPDPKAVSNLSRNLGYHADAALRYMQEKLPEETAAAVKHWENEKAKTKEVEAEQDAEKRKYGQQKRDIASEFGVKPHNVIGILPHSLEISVSEIARGMKRLFKKHLTAPGELPQDIFDRKVAKEGGVNREVHQMRFVMRDFRRGMKKALGGRVLTKADAKLVNSVLRGEENITKLPEPLREPVQAMRDHIDSLSRRLLASGAITGDLIGVVTENLGVYAVRSYQIFDDPQWRHKVPIDIRNKAAEHLRQEFPKATPEEIEGLIGSLLMKGEDANSPVSLLKGVKLGSKDMTSLIKRQDIPEPIRKLWGEYEDAGVNYTRSIFKIANLVESHKFLADVRDMGIGRYFSEKPISTEFGDLFTKIAESGESAMAPLNGLYTTPEIKAAFERAYSKGSIPDWLRLCLGIQSVVKYSKTVASPMTHIRNMISNTGLAIANGHWRVGKGKDAFKATMTGLFKVDSQKWRDYFLDAAKHGIVGEDIHAGDLRDAIQDATQIDIDEFVYNAEARRAKNIVGVGKAGLRGMTQAYQMEDAIWKLYAWENEKARYRKAFPEWTEEKLKAETAKIVRNTYPTYSMVSKAVKSLRRLPVVGTFPTFPAEIIRCTFNTIALGTKELKNPATRWIGAQRYAGTAVALTGLGTAARAFMIFFGISPEDDEALREFFAPWQKNSRMIYLDRADDAKFRFVDLGYSDPHSILIDPIMALTRGDDMKESLVNAAETFSQPFIGEDIFFQAATEVWRNHTVSGRPVYNDDDTVGQQAVDILGHLWKPLEPGAITSGKRIAAGLAGKTSETGRSYDPTVESLAVISGQRIQEIDVEQSLSWVLRDIKSSYRGVHEIMSGTANRRGSVGQDEITESYQRMEQQREKLFNRAVKVTKAAMNLGVDRSKVIKVLKDREFSREDIRQILQGQYKPYNFTESRLKSIVKANPEEAQARVMAAKRAEREALTQKRKK